MTPSELADKLEALESRGHMNTMDTEMFLNRETVLKSLRFAADMEKIYEHCGGEIVIRKRKEPQQEIQYLSGSVTRSKGSDIYTAARKAVEALEEKR